ncbi:MAG: YfhO family protein [Chloroflexi bacterium]|nr:YfhO family protein [Chloroflexota bacterium]
MRLKGLLFIQRTARRLQDHENLRVALLYALLIAVAYPQVVFMGKTLVASVYYPHGVVAEGPYGYLGRRIENTFNLDLASPAYYEFPVNRLVGEIYRRGQLPLWNPYQAAGTPLAAQYSSRAFFPYQIAEDILPPWTWDYFLLGRLWIAGFLTYLFLRALSLSPASSFLGGVFYMFSGSLVWFINLEQMANVAMLVPGLLLATEKLVRNQGGRYIACSALAFGLVLLAGQPETALYSLALAAAYFLFRVLRAGEGVRAILRQGGRYVFSFGLGLGLSAPLTLPFIELMGNSFHVHPPGGPVGIQGPIPYAWSVSLLVPTYFQEHTIFREFPQTGIWDFLGGYLGVVVVFLAFLGLLCRGRLGAYGLFFFLAGLVVLLKNFGVPPAKWLGYLPIFDQAWSDRWASPAWALSFAVAGAIGLESLGREPGPGMKGGISAGRLRLLGVGLVLLGLGLAWVILRPRLLSLPGPLTLKGQLVAAYFQALSLGAGGTAITASFFPREKRGGASVLSVAVALALVLFLLIALALVSPPPFPGEGGLVAIVALTTASILVFSLQAGNRKAAWGMGALAVLELWFHIPKGYNISWQYLTLIPLLIGLPLVFALARGKGRWAVLFALAPVLSYIIIDATAPKGLPQRYDPFTEAPYVQFLREKAGYYRIAGGDGVLMPNYAGALGVYDVRFINALSVNSYQHYAENSLLPGPHTVPIDRLWFTGIPDYLKPEESSFYQEIQERASFYSFLGVKYILAPSPVSIDMPLVYDGEAKVYENPSVLPRAFLVYQVEYASSYQQAQEALSRPDFDPLCRVVLEQEASFSPQEGRGTARIREYQPNRVVMETQSETPGILVLTDVFYPGWTAYIDGKAAKIYRANGLVRAVMVDKGDHTVVMSYFPRSLALGLAVALLAGVACLALMFRKRNQKGLSGSLQLLA